MGTTCRLIRAADSKRRCTRNLPGDSLWAELVFSRFLPQEDARQERNPGSRLRPLPLIIFRILPFESFHPSGRIHQLLLSGEERVALRADLYVYFLCCGAGFERVPARTMDHRFVIIRVYSLLHWLSLFSFPLLLPASSADIKPSHGRLIHSLKPKTLYYPSYLVFFQAKIPCCPRVSAEPGAFEGSRFGSDPPPPGATPLFWCPNG